MTRRQVEHLAAALVLLGAGICLTAAVHHKRPVADPVKDSPRETPSAASRSVARPSLPLLALAASPVKPQGAAPVPALATEPSSPSATRTARNGTAVSPASVEGAQETQTADKSSAGQPINQATTPSRTADTAEGLGAGIGEGAAPGPTAQYLALRHRIAWCESRLDPTAVNPESGAAGLFQFMPETFKAVTGLEPPASAYPIDVQRQAFDALYAEAGTSPWSASKSCWSSK